MNSETVALLDVIEGVIGDAPDSVNPMSLAESTLATLGPSVVARDLVAKGIKTRDSAPWHLLRARQLNRKGDAKRAGVEVAKALKLDDAWYPAHSEMALYRIRQGRIAEAAEAAERAVELNPNFADGHLMLGTVAFLQRRFADAAQAFRSLTVLSPETEEGYYLLGRALLMDGNVADARASVQRAHGSVTYGYRALILLGELAQRDKDTVSALSAYWNAARIQPRNPFPLVQLSRLASQSGLVDKGIQYAKQASSMAPNALTPKVALARAYVSAERVGTAIKVYGEIMEQHETVGHDIYVEFATILAKEKKWDEVEKVIDEALKGSPQSFKLINLKGRQEKAHNKYSDAVNSFDHAFQINPSHVGNRFMLARALISAKRYEEAVVVLDKVLEDVPGHPGAQKLIDNTHERLKTSPAKVSDINAESIFRFRPELAEAAKYVPVSLQLYNHFQAIVAYVIRETKGRYIAQKMGYFSSVLESLITMLMLLMIFKFIRNKQPGGMTLEEFLLTGLTMLNFVTLTMTAVAGVVKGKRGLMLSAQITTFTIRVGESFIQAITNILVAIFIAIGFNLIGIEILIADIPQVVLSVVLAVLMGSALGIIFEALTALWKFSKILQQALGRLLFFTSGVFFSVDDLPEALQPYVLLNPLMHLIEFVRNGFEPNYPMHGVSFTYVFAFVGGLLIVAFLMDKRLRDRVLAK